MKGQVRGLALELLRQDCVEARAIEADAMFGMAHSDETEGEKYEVYYAAKSQSAEACWIYNNALHGEPLTTLEKRP